MDCLMSLLGEDIYYHIIDYLGIDDRLRLNLPPRPLKPNNTLDVVPGEIHKRFYNINPYSTRTIWQKTLHLKNTTIVFALVLDKTKLQHRTVRKYTRKTLVLQDSDTLVPLQVEVEYAVTHNSYSETSQCFLDSIITTILCFLILFTIAAMLTIIILDFTYTL